MSIHAHLATQSSTAESSLGYSPLLPVPAIEKHSFVHANELQPGHHLVAENGEGYWVTAILRHPRTGRIHLMGRSDTPDWDLDATGIIPPIIPGGWGYTLRSQLHGAFEHVLAAPMEGSSEERLLHQQWLTNPACRSRFEPLRWHSGMNLPMVTSEDLITADHDSVSSDGLRIITASPFHLGTLATPYLLYDACGCYATSSPIKPSRDPSPFVFLPSSSTLAGHQYTWRDRTGTTESDPKVAVAMLEVSQQEQALLQSRNSRESLNFMRPAIGWAECSQRRPVRQLAPLIDYLRAQAPGIGIMPSALSRTAIEYLNCVNSATLHAIGNSEHPVAMQRFLSGRSPARDHIILAPIPYQLALWAEENS